MPKILIADDEPQVREMLEQSLEELEEAGVELLVAGNGMEALEAIRQHAPELVFLDALMPKMNGLEVCRAVKGTPGLQGVTIVLLTSEGQAYEQARMREAGADGTLLKPLDADTVYDRAVGILGLRL